MDDGWTEALQYCSESAAAGGSGYNLATSSDLVMPCSLPADQTTSAPTVAQLLAAYSQSYSQSDIALRSKQQQDMLNSASGLQLMTNSSSTAMNTSTAVNLAAAASLLHMANASSSVTTPAGFIASPLHASPINLAADSCKLPPPNEQLTRRLFSAQQQRLQQYDDDKLQVQLDIALQQQQAAMATVAGHCPSLSMRQATAVAGGYISPHAAASLGHVSTEASSAINCESNPVVFQTARMQALLHGLQLPGYYAGTTPAPSAVSTPPTRKVYSCVRCGKTLSSQHNLRLHEATIHQGLFQFRCPICAKGLRQERDLRGHLANRHDWKKEFRCTVCGHEFGYKRNLKQHMTSHHRWTDADQLDAATSDTAGVASSSSGTIAAAAAAAAASNTSLIAATSITH